MKRRTLALILGTLLALTLSGCGGTSPTEGKPPLTEDEIAQMYTDPNNFKNRSVTLVGKVFGDPEKDASAVYFQMFADPENLEKNTIVGYANAEIDLSNDMYVRVVGVVEGEYKGTNAYGAELSAPQILAESVEITSYAEAVSPTTKSVEVNSTQSQYGYEVTLQKIEFAESETRVYLSIKNNGSDDFSVYSFNTRIMQGSKQYEEQTNYNADYKDIQSDIMPGAESSGIIAFPTLEQSNFTIYIEGSSANWSEDIQPYVFDVAVS